MHIKVIAAELRVLLCLSGGTEGLLWRLADRLGVSDAIEVYSHGGVDPDHPLAKGLRLAVTFLQRPGAFAHPAFAKLSPDKVSRLRDVVKRDEAVYTLGRSFTHEQIIRKIAEQIGTAHADDGIEPGLATLNELLIYGRSVYFPILAFLAEATLEVGERVLYFAGTSGKYQRRRYSPPVSIVVHLTLREIPLGRVAIVTFQSHTAAVKVQVLISPRTFVFIVGKAAKRPTTVSVPFPSDWQEGGNVASCLVYDHRSKRLQAMGPNIGGESIEGCDLGYVHIAEFSHPQMDPAHEPYALVQGIHTHEHLFTPSEFAQLLQKKRLAASSDSDV